LGRGGASRVGRRTLARSKRRDQTAAPAERSGLPNPSAAGENEQRRKNERKSSTQMAAARLRDSSGLPNSSAARLSTNETGPAAARRTTAHGSERQSDRRRASTKTNSAHGGVLANPSARRKARSWTGPYRANGTLHRTNPSGENETKATLAEIQNRKSNQKRSPQIQKRKGQEKR
jgi:hypothetical protein